MSSSPESVPVLGPFLSASFPVPTTANPHLSPPGTQQHQGAKDPTGLFYTPFRLHYLPSRDLNLEK